MGRGEQNIKGILRIICKNSYICMYLHGYMARCNIHVARLEVLILDKGMIIYYFIACPHSINRVHNASIIH